MFRPACHVARRVHVCSMDSVRTKFIYPSLQRDPAEQIKQWNKENKELFGPLLETKKQRIKRDKTDKNKAPPATSEAESERAGRVASNAGSVDRRASTMWCNARGAALKLSYSSGFKTLCSANAAHSPSTADGFASDDRILQIRPHRNDYSQEYPSVTLILNKTMTDDAKAALDKWKQERIAEMGPEEFNRFYEAQMAVGTKFHATLKRYFTEPQHKLAIEKDVEGVWSSVSELLKNVTSPKAIESNVVHPVLKYRGIFDAIADYEDKPTLIEWKKSDRPRKAISLTYDNPVQLAAYFGAVSNDLNYKHLNVRDALLVIAYTDGSKADVYHLSVDKLREHWAHWLSRLEGYAKRHGSDAEKILKGGKRLFEEDIGNLQ